MGIVEIITILAIGAIAGWLAGQLMKGAGFGLIGNIVVGIIGSFIGTFLGGIAAGAGLAIPSPTLLSAIIWATLGAMLLLFVIGLVKKSA